MSGVSNGIARLLSSLSIEPNRRGQEFEELCRWYLLSDPVYRSQLSRVWLWKEWPGRWGDDEAGIDLIAETREGNLWAIQAKAYNASYSVKKADVDSFLSESARPEFSYRLLIASTNKLARHAERAMNTQEKPVGQLLLHDLERSEVAWPGSVSDLRPETPKPKAPRPHQRTAIEAVVSGCAQADRGQVIMACGTGKTLVALWSAEALDAERTLVLVPSLSLLRQTIQEWAVNSSREFEFLPVCSDDTVRDRDQVVANVAELGFPATGDPQTVREFLARPGPRVVFSTYQSSPVVASALESTSIVFDLAIADEAHRCAGSAANDFATILDDSQISVRKRVFMTATPRYFTGKMLRAGADTDYEIVSMDDEGRFGAVHHRLTFSDAIERDLLSDYRVLVIGVDDAMYLRYAQEGLFVLPDGHEVTDARALATQIGVANAIRKYGLSRIITFHSRVKAARDFAESLPEVVAWLPPDKRPRGELWAEHVSGEMNAGKREARLGRLREVEANACGVLSNARCLAEGVDVPALDGVAFVDPKKSAVDIAQAVGRAIRKSEAKELGTIVIPVFIESGGDAEAALDSSRFRPVWDVVRALREHDSDLAEALDELRRGLSRDRATAMQLPAKLVVDLPVSITSEFARAFEAHLVESCTSRFEHWFGLLIQFVEREGHSRVPGDHIEYGFKLGIWVTGQRWRYKKNRLDVDHIARLEAQPGWVWDANRAAWDEGFAALQAFVERERHARVPQLHVELGVKLGKWVNKQRSRYAAGTLETGRVAQLEGIQGWVWKARKAIWEKRFALLRAYVDREGHSRVPKNHVEDGDKLGSWVQEQRGHERDGRLSVDRKSRLEVLPGWIWHSHDTMWEERFAALLAFADREGNSRVPFDHIESGQKLGQWTAHQRRLYKDGTLAPHRVVQLEQLPGWVWDLYREAWDEQFAALKAYARSEGHSSVPSGHIESGANLGSWTTSQRRLFREGRLTPEQVTLLEGLPEWSWEPNEDAWEAGFAALRAFVEREGHYRVPLDHVESGYNLGNWVSNQRSLFATGRLAEERVAQLEALAEWTWNTRQDAWEESFKLLRAYVSRKGHAGVPTDHVESGFKLGAWIRQQRTSYKSGKLEPQRVARLEAQLGWLWDANNAAWEEGFAALSEFVEREGNARVPADHMESGLKLGNWAPQQRGLYKANKLAANRVARLESLPGWTWSPHESRWEKNFQALCGYVNREGHARVPVGHVESGVNLGSWVNTQRTHHKSQKLEPERVARLGALPGWIWDHKRAVWEDKFSTLVGYAEREGHACVPVSHVEAGTLLGSWVNTQRQSYKSGKLAVDRVARLEALPGWKWTFQRES